MKIAARASAAGRHFGPAPLDCDTRHEVVDNAISLAYIAFVMHQSLSRAALAVFVAALFVVVAVSGFASPAGEEPAGDRIAVVATTTIVADIVARVGGERIALTVLLPPGADPHVFQPTPRDVRLVADATVVFANGAGLEMSFLGDLIRNAAPRRLVELSEHLPLLRMADAHGEHDEHEDDEHDEHGDDDHHDEGEEDDGHEHDGEDDHDEHDAHEDEDHDDP